MNKIRFTFKAFAFLAFTIACATAAQAQATRTWVSGVGDDVNPCSRTAPCKTFAGAISKTADKGEIDALDPGGFGTITITKNITIDGAGTMASILAAGTNGVNINDSLAASPNTIVVALRNLSINGAGSGFDGIRFVSGKTVHIEDCVISGFKGNGANSDGIDIALTAVASGNQNVKIKNTIVRDTTGNGIRASNTAVGGAVLIEMDNVHADSTAGSGFLASTSCAATIANSYFTYSTNGVNITTGALQVDIDTTVFSGNGNGITAAASTARIAGCRISGNNVGINFTGGAVQSFGDNKVKGNFSNDQLGGAVTSVPAPIKI